MARPRKSTEPNYQGRALQRGLRMLGCFTPAAPRLTLSDLAAQLDLPKPTVLRLAEILRGEGFLTYSAAEGVYSLGTRAFEVGSAFLASSPLEQPAMPFLRSLAAATNETVNLGVTDGRHVVHLAVVEPERPLRYHSNVGARDSLHCTGLGKILASEMDDRQISDVIGSVGLERRTPATIVDAGELRLELARVRRLGYAEDREEAAPGLRCLAAPVRGAKGQLLAALSISGPAAEFEGRNREAMLSALLDAARGISERLGWAPLPGREAVAAG